MPRAVTRVLGASTVMTPIVRIPKMDSARQATQSLTDTKMAVAEMQKH